MQTGLSKPILLASFTVLLSALWQWPRRWLLSGAPLLQFFILLGDSRGNRVLPYLHLWPVISTFNLIYAICSTSWLLYWVFTAFCYPSIFLVCLFQFGIVADFVRRKLRALLKELHFIDDKIAFFNIPALEIDTEVDGLMVLRGVTFSLSTLSFVVHGVEVGIKLTDDMELAIQTEEVTVKLFRSIEIGDCYANLKGGQYEMTFGALDAKSKDQDGDSIFLEGTPLLKAATFSSASLRGRDSISLKGRDSISLKRRDSFDSVVAIDSPIGSKSSRGGSEERVPVKMKAEMTGGHLPEDSSPSASFNSMEKLSPDNEEARGRYRDIMNDLRETNTIHEARLYTKDRNREASISNDLKGFDDSDINSMRAAICSHIHVQPSVPHPPQKSIKVTTLQNLSSPRVRRFLHRLPMLLRMLLNPLSYFHPVNISSITATASGQWLESMLVEKIFQDYAEQDREIRSLKQRIASWLSDANFAVSLAGITGLAQVPFIPSYDIICQLAIDDVMAYRALPHQVYLQQVIRLGGADAHFHVPSFLLPHHEHLLPPVPSIQFKRELEENVDSADGKPKEMQAQQELEQAHNDETNVGISVHARLPAVFHQELLDFVAALVKAGKVVEIEKQTSAMDDEVHGIKDFTRALKGGMKEGVKKAVVDGVVNDRWISKMVGKITRKLEVARGEAGYSGDIPVQLSAYRTGAIEEGEKLLP